MTDIFFFETLLNLMRSTIELYILNTIGGEGKESPILPIESNILDFYISGIIISFIDKSYFALNI